MTYAIAPAGNIASYMTPGKAYEVRDDGGVGFEVTDDVGDQLNCPWKGCAHLGGADWVKSGVDWSKPLEWVNSCGENQGAVEFVGRGEVTGSYHISTKWGAIFANADGSVVGGVGCNSGCTRSAHSHRRPDRAAGSFCDGGFGDVSGDAP